MASKSDGSARFDRWAERYDEVVRGAPGFPLIGYEAVLDRAMALATARSGMSVLDLGTGTGNLAGRFAAAGCDVWGIDFSEKMLERARSRHPGVRFVRADFLDPLPDGFPSRFDRIVSAYAVHHLDLDGKIALIERLARDHLQSGGRMVMADVSFPTVSERAAARVRFDDLWDDEEFYWAADEMTTALEHLPLRVTYVQASPCAGVFVLDPVPASRFRPSQGPAAAGR